MKTTITGLKYFFVALFAALLFSACNPCEGVVCDYGTCANGICVCEDGYERKNTDCKPIHERYVDPEDSAVIATYVVIDANGGRRTFNNIGYVFETAKDAPYNFTLTKFNFLNDNDITFEIDPTNYSVLVPGSMTTGIGKSYSYEGSKTDDTIMLKITDTATQFTYIVTYTR
ncbi:MAG: hypothetical protein ACRBFS_03565 [Aureispira sp.]